MSGGFYIKPFFEHLKLQMGNIIAASTEDKMTTVKLEKFIKASPTEIYRYFTNSTGLRDWMCDVATADPRPGGHLYLGWPGEYYTSGEYIALEPDKSVSFTWFGRGEPRSTRVDVTLKKKRGGTLVKLIHRGAGSGEKWTAITQVYQKEWESSFENLASVLEEGADLRITRRPMLGIYLGDYDAAYAARLGVPVDYGTRLDGVVDGMGAQKAGLQQNDVVVAVDSHELTAGTSLGTLLSGRHAGDVVEVTFYRGPEKKTVKMTLSGRPIPSIPASAAELSQQVRQAYQKFEADLEKILQDASEAECSRKPAPGEWSAKEILAHLIQSEVGWQNVVGEIMGGNEGYYDGFGGNIQARIDGTVAIFPTKDALFTELKNHDAETVSLIASIPAEFLAHKGRFWKIVYQNSQNPYHQQTHIEQLRASIQSARK